MRRTYKYRCLVALLLCVAFLVSPLGAMKSEAGIKDATVFENVVWKYLGETATISDTGWLQSMCCTEDYIICLENSSSTASTPDTFLAFYKNDVDEDGKPVEKYSLAKQVTETDYEHANGMAYNPHTGEILVVGASTLNPDNKGLIYVVDAKTLKLKDTVRLSYTYKLLGIAYSEDTDEYVIQLYDDDYTYSFFIVTDTNFEITRSFDAVMWNEIRHQDFCVSGDYLISLAFTNGIENSNVMHIYSVSTGEFLLSYDLDITENGEFIEPESICELSPGEILLANALKNPRRIAFYETTVAAAFSLTTNVSHGTISGSQKTVDYGSSYTVNYEPDEDYEISKITIDGEAVSTTEHASSYTFDSMDKNHTVDVSFKEKPRVTLTAKVRNGFVDASVVKHRDNDYTIYYGPNEHYMLSRLEVDGVSMPLANYPDHYDFINIQEDHEIIVEFSPMPTYSITTEAVHGTITESVDAVYKGDIWDVYYKPDPGYALAYMDLDGHKTFFFNMGDHWNDYRFKDVGRNHHLKVVYYWKLLPWIIVAVIMTFALFVVTLMNANGRAHRRRVMKRRYKRRKKIRKRRMKNRKKAEAKVRGRMQASEESDE